MAFRKKKKSGDAGDPLVTRALNPIGLDINSLSDASSQHAASACSNLNPPFAEQWSRRNRNFPRLHHNGVPLY